MGTGHLQINVDEVKNLRTDVIYDDGSTYTIEDGKAYWLQNTGNSEVSVCERAVERGAPTLDSPDFVLIPLSVQTQVKIEDGFNYYVWSLNAPSKLSVNHV